MLDLILALIVAYLGWRLWAGPKKRRSAPRHVAPSSATGDADAWHVLGLAPGAGADEIRAAHRRLIAEAHPDRGGSADRARRINRARDILLERHD